MLSICFLLGEVTDFTVAVVSVKLQSVTFELRSIDVVMLCSTSFYLSLSMLALNSDNCTENHYKTTLEERKTSIRAMWLKLSVLDSRWGNGTENCSEDYFSLKQLRSVVHPPPPPLFFNLITKKIPAAWKFHPASWSFPKRMLCLRYLLIEIRGTQRLFSVKCLFGEANIAENFYCFEDG